MKVNLSLNLNLSLSLSLSLSLNLRLRQKKKKKTREEEEKDKEDHGEEESSWSQYLWNAVIGDGTEEGSYANGDHDDEKLNTEYTPMHIISVRLDEIYMNICESFKLSTFGLEAERRSEWAGPQRHLDGCQEHFCATLRGILLSMGHCSTSGCSVWRLLRAHKSHLCPCIFATRAGPRMA